MKTMHRMARALVLLAACVISLQARAAFIEQVAGNNQTALVGAVYAQPWVVRVAPFEVVRFGNYYLEGFPNVTFDGADSVYVTANEYGLATSPLARANLVAGRGSGYALGDAGWMDFDFINLSPGLTAVFEFPLQPSVPIGYPTMLPFKGRVLQPNGQPAANVHFVFSTDPACGAFDGGATFEGLTAEDGIATSPLFTGTAHTYTCHWSLAFDGAEPLLERWIHVYPIQGVGIMVNPAAVDAATGQEFILTVSFGADGQAIAVPPGVAMQITTAKTGATASVYRQSLYEIFSNYFRVSLMPNNMPGNYEVIFTVGPNSLAVPITQRPPRGPR
jgi:hypothetical protein